VSTESALRQRDGDRVEINGAKEKAMEPGKTDEAAGKIHVVKGKIKEEIGKVTNDPGLEESGQAEKDAGTVQRWISRVKKIVGE
jgi:uncharacterized protein YjbJ (UPF0337 family)